MGIIADLDTAVAAIEVAADAMRKVRDTQFLSFTDPELLDLAHHLEHLSHLVYTAQIHLVADLHHRGTAGTRGCTSTAALLHDTLAISPTEAKTRVNTARAVIAQETTTGALLDPKLPALRAAVDTGTLGNEQIRIIETTMRKLPGTVDPVTRNSCEHTLVDHGRTMDPHQLAGLARKIRFICDPDGDPDTNPTDRVELSIGSRNPETGMSRITGHLDDEGVELLTQAIDADSKPHTTDGQPDRRTPANRRGLALKEALRRSLDLGEGPTRAGERPHLTLTMDFQDLKNNVGYATLEHGGPISAAEARRLACDANIIPVVMGSNSQVLDVGRSSRSFPIGIRRAITLRDKGCAFPGCDRPPGWTDGHHVKHWTDDGHSAYNNGCLLCRFHHTTIHKGEWTITWATDGTPEFIPPPWIDPTQKPRRNTMHNIDALVNPDLRAGGEPL